MDNLIEEDKVPVLVYSALIRLLRLAYAKLEPGQCITFDDFISKLVERKTMNNHFSLPYNSELERKFGMNQLERNSFMREKMYSLSQGFDVSRDALATIYVSQECFERIESICTFGCRNLSMPLQLKDGTFKTAPVVAGLLIGSVLGYFDGFAKDMLYESMICREFAYCKADGHGYDMVIAYPYSLDDEGKTIYHQVEGCNYFEAMTRSFEGYVFI